jgi:hypothetical protein
VRDSERTQQGKKWVFQKAKDVVQLNETGTSDSREQSEIGNQNELEMVQQVELVDLGISNEDGRDVVFPLNEDFLTPESSINNSSETLGSSSISESMDTTPDMRNSEGTQQSSEGRMSLPSQSASSSYSPTAMKKGESNL